MTVRHLGFALLVTVNAAVAHAASLPAGFREVIVATGLSRPTAMTVAADGRVFVCLQAGQLRVIKDGALLAAPFVSLSVNSEGERGLLGVAVDPQFAANRFVYVYYTTASAPVRNRVSRFTASASGDVAVAGSERVLLELEPLGATNHNGGAIHFGGDGKLYVAVGENAVRNNSQKLDNRLGKILRINSDGSIPDDNPFFNLALGDNRSIWALGLRNPFTFAVDPQSGRIFINDVGEGAWEEINDGIAGANYGWPATEGPTTNPEFATPFSAYDRRNTSSCAIAGGAFYSPQTAQFPAEYLGSYFFADLCGGWIRRLDVESRAVTAFATGIPNPVDLQVADDGSLYYLARGNGGFVARITADADPVNVQVTKLNAPARVAVGGSLAVTDTTRNAGPGDVGATQTGFWLSVNKTLDANDIVIGQRAVPALVAGRSDQHTTTLTLPVTPAGTYYLIAGADRDGLVTETNESDNRRVRKVLVGPDLTLTMSIAPSPPQSTSPATITIRVKNNGAGVAAASSTRLYRSTNATVDASDTLLQTFALPALAAQATATVQGTVTLPAGTYFLIAIADANGSVGEVREDNNVAKTRVTVP